MNKSKKDKVLDILRRDGKIDNFDLVHGVHGFISLRLSDLIFQLKQEGKIEVDEEKSHFLPGTKNYRYVVKPLIPKRIDTFYVDGIKVAPDRYVW